MVTPLSVVGVSSDELTLVAALFTRKLAPYDTFGTKEFWCSEPSADLNSGLGLIALEQGYALSCSL